MVTLWGATVWPAVPENETELGDTETTSGGAALTVKVIVEVSVPVYVSPPVVRPTGVIVRVRVAGVVPEVGLTESHVPPVCETVNGAAPKLD
jgi:hypothetical protein